ncbi:MAG: alpha/beta hydrolase [Terracidiphilus sp.]|jgi:hypothetical protein
MTQFLDCRLSAVGGELAATVAVNQGTSLNDYSSLGVSELVASVRGRHVLIATHGFNMDRADAIACLSNWGSILQLPQASAFVGLLWPGDSIWAHGLDYAVEAKVADDAGVMIAEFVDTNFATAASVSFASHSLGARVILSTISNMSLPVRQVTIMAGALDDDALTNEFATAAGKIGQISVLSSAKDEVLTWMFPIGNLASGIIAVGHPWWHAALGQAGPAQPWPANMTAPYGIPDNWGYQHCDYLAIHQPPAPSLPIPTEVPPNGAAPLCAERGPNGEPVAGWTEVFSAAFASSRFR